ncbi:DUF1080 domain-containing protein [Luteolibacter sp. SL250]|uniref:3-keto-disaccharide hydrolase n=1 Tax=Luteolibacter sp. SL250 TaxID=2995170 RepID=UPI00226F9E9F|nr:DUF1080 domain-containing protein [Luteolibacter sp. SL250]WAC19946.1 DUF1080 domain-containing protein [Luteolibacter sp. SL250]
MKKYLLPLIPLLAAGQAFAQARPLFNGKDLTGWKGEGYIVEDGAIVATPKARNLVTEDTFANYVLEFDFQLTPGANNGLGINYPGEGDAAYTGLELQILDDTAEKYKDLKDAQFHGSIYLLAAAKKGSLKPVGEWNHQKVTVTRSSVVVVLNGNEILRRDLDDLSLRNRKHKGAQRIAGHIAFLGHGDKVSFKNITIEEMPLDANIAGVTAAGFSQIFNGKDLAGWKHDPNTANWAAVNGILKHNGKAAEIKDLWTEKEYGDFQMAFDWRWTGRGNKKAQPVVLPDGNHKVGPDGQPVTEEIEEMDSGIYLRGSTKAQVNLWNWSVGSGEVYGYRMDKSQPEEIRAGVTPTVRMDRPQGEWNRMMITLKGDVLTVLLNGRKVIEEAQLPGIPAKGPIGLQHHGQAIEFANIWVKDL